MDRQTESETGQISNTELANKKPEEKTLIAEQLSLLGKDFTNSSREDEILFCK